MNTQSKEVLKITARQWHVSHSPVTKSNLSGRYYKSVKNSKSVGGKIILNAFGDTKQEAEDNAIATSTAVNETYGKGYNPAAMEELVNVLHNIRRDLEKYGACHRDVLPEIETALQNSKLSR